MHYHWLREQHSKKQFNIYWDKGSNNYTDYFTKYHLAKYHLYAQQALKYMKDN